VGIPPGAEWWEWNDVSLMGHEVTSHTLHHPDLTTVDKQTLWEEVVLSKRYIQENISTASSETFCCPYGSYNDMVLDLVKQHYIAARDRPYGSPSPVNSSPSDLYTVVSVKFGTNETVAEMNQLVEDAVDMRGWLVEMLHEIGDHGYEPVSPSNFTAHLDYLVSREDAIWVAPFVNVIKYIKERDDTDLDSTLLSDYSFTLYLNSSLDPAIYNEDLTLNVTLPLDWSEVQVEIGSVSRNITPWIAGENRYFLFDSPINEAVTISKSAPVLSFIEAYPGANSSFFPESGDWNTVFTFRVNYSSPLNLEPYPWVECLLDINGDGDMLDVFGGMCEGRYPMEKVDPSDTDYTDGCLYQLNTSFPFASSPWFAFAARDVEGQAAFDPDDLTTMRPGPEVANFIVLKEGWNLISLPLIPPDVSLQAVLQSIDGQYDAVQWYNVTDSIDPWKHNYLSKPSNLNDLNEISQTMGLWVHVTEPGETRLVVPGDMLVSTQIITLYPGWNLVGYPSTTDKVRLKAMNNIFFDTDVDAVWTYNATAQKWKEITASDDFEVGRGYWMHSKVTKPWIVPL
jgi:hypothetical protein